MRAQLLAVAKLEDHVAHLGLDGGDLDRGDEFDLVALGLRDESLGQVGPVDPFRKPRVVLDPLGRARLSAERALLDDDNADPLTRGVESAAARPVGPPPTMTSS